MSNLSINQRVVVDDGSSSVRDGQVRRGTIKELAMHGKSVNVTFDDLATPRQAWVSTRDLRG